MPVYISAITITNCTSATSTYYVSVPTYASTATNPINMMGAHQTGVVWYQPTHSAYDDWAEMQRMTQHEVSRQQRALDRHSDQAKDRARELLLKHLSPAQRETFEKNKWFIVEGGQSQTKYRINDSRHMVANIDVLADETNKVKHRLCGHCGLDAVPIGDQLLAQKLMLEYDEDRFLRLANRHPARAA